MQQLPKFCFILLLVSNLSTLYSQDYKPMAIESATWVVSGYGDYNLNAWAFRIEGDTTVNQTLYKKLLHYDLDVEYDNFNNQKEFTVRSINLLGLMRDEIANRKVYFLPLSETFYYDSIADSCKYLFNNASEELLLFDFDITVGDTSDHCMVNFGYLPPIVQKDTVINIFNEPRRALSFLPNTSETYLSLIEGIGYYDGLFTEFTDIISAAKGYGLYSYCVGSLWDCRLITSISQQELDDAISLYPNPVIDELIIETNETPMQFEFINIHGQTIMLVNAQDKNSKINLSTIKEGSYFIKITYPDSSFGFRRFVKI